MIHDEYSPYKIVHHPEIIEKMKTGQHFAPLQVHLVPTNRCNQNCSFCAYRMHGYSSSQNFGTGDQMPTDKLLELIDDLKSIGTNAVQFTGGGEPTVHKDIIQAFRKVIENGMSFGLVSNGVNWDDEIIECLTHAAWVRVSVDCFHPETYAKTRNVKVEQYHRMISNVENLIKIKNNSTILGIGYVVTKDNWKEVYQSAKFFKELGVDNFRISAAFTDEGIRYFDGWFEEAQQEVLRTHQDFNSPDFTVFNLFDNRINDLFDGTQDYNYCPMKDLVPYIGADLNVYTCCTLAYNNLGFIDSIKDQKFSDMWFSEKVEKFMRNHSPRKFCRLPCMFEKKNEFINYCTKPDAKHTEFI